MTTATTKHYQSTSHLCATLQATHARIVRAIENLGIKPAEIRNGLSYYDEGQCEQIAAAVKESK